MSANRKPPMSDLMEFNPYLQPIVDQGGLTVVQAWYLEILMNSDVEPSKSDLLLITWCNLVQMPAELMQRQ